MMRDSVAASWGSGGIVLAGAAGVGKSRLAREIIDHARRTKRRCHWLYATNSARSVPLGVFAEHASSFGADPLRRVHEVITALTGDRPGPANIVGVDDAHLLDEQSALVVHQLVQRRAASVVLTMRTGEPAPDAITSLYKDQSIPRLELQPLSAVDVVALLERVLGGPVESWSAQRLWRYTRGNVLYLRQLIEDELARGKLSQRSGMWVWTGNPEVSPTLTDLIESNVGRHGAAVVEVIDAVAIADPLELNVLQSLAPAAAIDEAEAQGVVVIDSVAGLVRLAHPLYGEARRRRLGTLQRAALGRRISDAIAELCPPTAQRLVRRAVLTTDSDQADHPKLFAEAAQAAMHLLDLDLAVSFAEKARRKDRSPASEVMYAFTLMTAGRAEDAERVLLDLDGAPGDSPELALMGFLRAANLGWGLGRLDAADAVLDAGRDAAVSAGLASSFDAVRSSIQACRGHAPAAAASASSCMQAPDLHPTAAMFCTWGLTAALGDLGDVDALIQAAQTGYTLANSEPEASHLRFGAGVSHVEGLLMAGFIAEAEKVTTDLHRQAQDLPSCLAITTLLLGMCALSRGDLAQAQRWYRESGATYQYVTAVTELASLGVAIALAMGGDRDGARRHIDAAPQRYRAEVMIREPTRALADAWSDAAAGQVSSALETMRAAARSMRDAGRPAREVWCLQTAIQFGDTTTADRLAELAQVVQGPRAPTAAAHAAALVASDGSALLSASEAYEAFGDKLAATDAAAQAAAAFTHAGSRGSALTAAAVATRLAEVSGAQTHALQTTTARAVLTPRQHEVVSLAAAGLSNRDIAARLHMSIRSVEGHIFRASQRNGVKTREALAALLQGRTRTSDGLG